MSGSNFGDKVLLTILWQRTSERGTEYLSRFLGKARIIGFRGEPTADGIPTWDLYLQPGKEEERAGARAAWQPTTSNTSSRSSNDGPRARGVQRYQQPQEAADDRPFYDGPIDDLGGSSSHG